MTDRPADPVEILRRLQSFLDVYEQRPDDDTRGWCSDLSTYLRGGVGVLGVIDRDTWAEIEAITGVKSQRMEP